MSWLRATGWAEAVSFLVLLGVAMPLKYLAGRPEAVKIVGWIHGLLFTLFCVALLFARLPLRRAAEVFVVSLLPFGPFLFDRRIRRYEAER